MATYCITAANHTNLNNQIASSFYIWQQDELAGGWKRVGARSEGQVIELLQHGNTVLTAQYDAIKHEIDTGAAVEIELRITKNDVRFPISKMPTF
jgi:hypothetical protein